MSRKDSLTRRDFLVSGGLATSALLLDGAAQTPPTSFDPALRLWYRQPAPDWNEALPLGNGRLGAMIFGGVETEHLQLNENTLYSDEPGRRDVKLDFTKEFDKVVGMLRKRQYAEASDFITQHWLGRAQPCYQPLGDLHLYFEQRGEVSDYSRDLDLATAVSSVRYKQDGVTFTREYFASHPDQVIVIKLTADRPQSLSFRAALSSVHPTAKTKAAGRDVIVMTGQVPGFALRRELSWVEQKGDQWKYPEIFDAAGKRRPGAKPVLYGDEIEGLGTRFDARLRAVVQGGEAEARSDGLHVRRASEVLLILAAGTSFNGFDKSPSRQGADASARAAADLERAAKKSFPALRQVHVRDYQTLFNRVSLNLGAASEQSRLPTDERVTKFTNDQDPALAALYFQFGRYLMIVGSRPGGQPLNLQGLWNSHVIPPWASAYTTNINAQMNYWPAEVTNLSECHEPLFRMIRELRVTGSQVARQFYARRGWVEHHNTTIWRDAQPVDFVARTAFWPMGGAWFCQHLWEHYQFTGDRAFLASEAYPALKGAAEFCSDWLVDDGQGRLVTVAGSSPEIDFNYVDAQGQKKVGSVTMGPTMDLAIIRELFANCIRTGELLNRDPELRAELKAKLAKLLPYQVGQRGQLQEWPEDLLETDSKHRHISHLYALHPSNQITRRGTPKLFEAARRTLELRGDVGTGWSMAWKINFWARMEDGEHAYQLVRKLFTLAKSSDTKYDRGGVMPNLLCSHPPFQIDGNFGGTAGIAEMLLQSHAGELHLLPALPAAWATGQVRGLCARGGLVVDISWRNGKLTEARLLAKLGGVCVIRYGEQTIELKTERGKLYRLNGSLGKMTA
jgi:alpha-L-fucosidase 2